MDKRRTGACMRVALLAAWRLSEAPGALWHELAIALRECYTEDDLRGLLQVFNPNPAEWWARQADDTLVAILRRFAEVGKEAWAFDALEAISRKRLDLDLDGPPLLEDWILRWHHGKIDPPQRAPGAKQRARDAMIGHVAAKLCCRPIWHSGRRADPRRRRVPDELHLGNHTVKQIRRPEWVGEHWPTFEFIAKDIPSVDLRIADELHFSEETVREIRQREWRKEQREWPVYEFIAITDVQGQRLLTVNEQMASHTKVHRKKPEG